VRSNILRDNGSMAMIMIGSIDIIDNTVIAQPEPAF
jgi:hypothetical protein